MYRLLGARNLYQGGFHNISTPSSSTLKQTSIAEIKCSFCRKVLIGRHNIGQSNNKSQFHSYFYTIITILQHKHNLFVSLRNLGFFSSEKQLLIRHQSTRTASALQKSAKKKPKFKSNKRYGELLQGTYLDAFTKFVHS